MNKIFALTGLDRCIGINLKCDPQKTMELSVRYDKVTSACRMSKKQQKKLSEL